MNFKKVTILLIIIFFFFSVGFLHAADVAKIGVIDFQGVLKKSEPGKAAQAKINEQGKKMEADLKEKGRELEELKNKLEREALVMTKERREEKERDFRIKVNDFKALEKKYKVKLAEINQRLVEQFQKEIFKIVEEIGKQEGYLLIIERNEAGVVYYPNTIDITDRIIQKYNAEFASKNEKSK